VPIAAGAQQPTKLWRIGILNYTLPTADMAGLDPKSPYVGAFVRVMRDLGYVYGRHFVTEPRGGEAGPERLPVCSSPEAKEWEARERAKWEEVKRAEARREAFVGELVADRFYA
jgi:hypothetical protein